MTHAPTWRDAYTAEQASMSLPAAGNVLQVPPPPVPCGARNGYLSYTYRYTRRAEDADELGRYTCTRPAGHEGDHHHATADGVVAVWKDELVQRRGSRQP